jgi:hypothetical protein
MNSPRLTSIDIDGWMVDDGEVAHATSPDTYWIPSLADRLSLRPGDMAKLRFYIRVVGEDGDTVDEGESMWVWITGCLGHWYRGQLDNQPCCTDDIGPGLEVWFQARHVIDVIRFEEIPEDSRRFIS